ncbi:sugar transporter ERD6-like 16 isoform X2 [Arachis hypogaea]|uniref:sugar transporter ERD6-like 16 isoform X2 n=1 Tax=Arachis hypogaea TaxID=3818 RepID=UPI0010FC5DC2|nr:sugar transporter ERD6-like 16 [Arachis hypogaea]
MRFNLLFCLLQDPYSLDFGRFFTGYGIGVISYVVPIYIAEIAPKNLRGGLATINQLMIVIRASDSFLIGIVITWRQLALAEKDNSGLVRVQYYKALIEGSG